MNSKLSDSYHKIITKSPKDNLKLFPRLPKKKKQEKKKKKKKKKKKQRKTKRKKRFLRMPCVECIYPHLLLPIPHSTTHVCDTFIPGYAHI